MGCNVICIFFSCQRFQEVPKSLFLHDIMYCGVHCFIIHVEYKEADMVDCLHGIKIMLLLVKYEKSNVK